VALQHELDRLKRAVAGLIPLGPDPAQVWWEWWDQRHSEMVAIRYGELPKLDPPYPLEPALYGVYLEALGVVNEVFPPDPMAGPDVRHRLHVMEPERLWAIAQAHALGMADCPDLRTLWPDPMTLGSGPPSGKVPPARARWEEGEMPHWWDAHSLVFRAAAERAGAKLDWDKPLPPRPGEGERRR
jgi:hypothetical protein